MNTISFISFILAMSGEGYATSNKNDEKIMIEDFSSSVHNTWEEMNDMVMGGESTGRIKITKKDDESTIGRFTGYVAMSPAIHVPGFIKAKLTTSDDNWPNLSSCTGFEFKLESHTNYDTFRVSFGKNRVLPYAYGYKADLKIPYHDIPIVIRIPFTHFTDNWDASTGNAIITCEEDEQYCPDHDSLSNDLYAIVIWAEGSEGDVELDIYNIQAYDCKATNDNNNKPNEAIIKKKNEIKKRSFDEQNDDEIMLEDFSHPIHHWHVLNDRSGQSISSVKMNYKDGIAKFDGTVRIVPNIDGSNFVSMINDSSKANFPDISGCNAFKVLLRSTKKQKQSDEYAGYRISFRGSDDDDDKEYKAPALKNIPTKIGEESLSAFTNIPIGKEFTEYILPFDTFSSDWDTTTGDVRVPCDFNDKQYCPTQHILHKISSIRFWGEGIAGEVSLEIKSISAVGCKGSRTITTSLPHSSTTESSNTIDIITTTAIKQRRNYVPNNEATNSKNSTIGIVFYGFGIISLIIAGTISWKKYSSYKKQHYCITMPSS